MLLLSAGRTVLPSRPQAGHVTLKGHWGSGCTFPPFPPTGASYLTCALLSPDRARASLLALTCPTPLPAPGDSAGDITPKAVAPEVESQRWCPHPGEGVFSSFWHFSYF